MRSATLFLSVLLLGAATVADRAPPLHAAETDDDDGPVSLEDRLKVGLKARRPEENEFLERVAALVQSGKLPRKLVDSTYLWAIRRRQDSPFPAFERALQLQADRLGVDL
jgi:hypothetical protein